MCAVLATLGVSTAAVAKPLGQTSGGGHGILFSHAPLSSPNGAKYGGDIYLWAPGRAPRALTKDGDPRNQAQWSPDGTDIAYVASPGWNGQGYVSDAPPFEIFSIHSNGSQPTQLSKDGEPNGPAPDADFTSSPTWSPDSRRILFLREFPGRPGQLAIVPARGGKEITLHPIDPGSDGAFWWQQNGIGYIAYSSQQGAPARIELLNPGNGHSKTLARVNLRGKQILAAAWSSTTRHVAMIVQTVSSGRTNVVIYSETGRKLASFPTLIPKPHWQACALSWSPDGTHFAVVLAPAIPPYPSRYDELYEVRTTGANWQRLPVKPSTCSVSWR